MRLASKIFLTSAMVVVVLGVVGVLSLRAVGPGSVPSIAEIEQRYAAWHPKRG